MVPAPPDHSESFVPKKIDFTNDFNPVPNLKRRFFKNFLRLNSNKDLGENNIRDH